jgi:L-methionine (R)-S-oxide reductase
MIRQRSGGIFFAVPIFRSGDEEEERMSPETRSIAPPSRRDTYRSLLAETEALLDRLDDPVAAMATAASAVHARLPYASWTGFYRVVGPGLLRIGPYQGPVGCLEIPFDRGVCGAAARELRSQLVPDVHAFPGHIACDAAARSEVVVPVVTPAGRLVAVLDVDSHQPNAFTEDDVAGLEAVAERVGRVFSHQP